MTRVIFEPSGSEDLRIRPSCCHVIFGSGWATISHSSFIGSPGRTRMFSRGFITVGAVVGSRAVN